MTAILNGSLRAEIVSDAGARIKRLSLRQATAGRFRPSQPTLQKPLDAWQRAGGI